MKNGSVPNDRAAQWPLPAGAALLLALVVYFLAPLVTKDAAASALALPIALLFALGVLLLRGSKPLGAARLCCVLALLALSLLARLPLLAVQTRDYTFHLSAWLADIRALPGAEALGASIGNYNLPYVYLLFLIGKLLPVSLELYAIKLVSAAFDLLLAYYVLRLVQLADARRRVGVAAFLCAFLLPSVLVNGAMWGQCDSIFTALALGGLYYGLRGKSRLCWALFTLSFTFKLQAVFLLPMLPVLLFCGRVRLRDAWVLLAAAPLTLVPALLAGRGLIDCLSIYLGQTGAYTELSLYAPSAYVFLGGGLATHRGLTAAGVLLAGALVLLLLCYLYRRRRALDNEALLTAALLFALVMPYFLPTMHERYFYAAEALACAYLFTRPARWHAPALICVSSFLSHMIYLFAETQIVPLWLLSLFMLFALCLLARALLLHTEKKAP